VSDEPGSDGGAQDRTSLAEERTVLANERTFAAWMRTGLAAIGVGLGFHALFNKLDPAWVPKAIATAFLLMAILILLLAERGARRVTRKLQAQGTEELPPVTLRLVAWTAVAAAAALIAAIWLLTVKGA
jgi:putative membrane protein